MNPNWLTSLVVVVMILTKLVMSSKLSETQLLPCGASLKKITSGYYWSSSVTGNDSHYLDLGAGNGDLEAESFRTWGFSLRCILD